MALEELDGSRALDAAVGARFARVASAGVLVVEAAGALLMLGAMPLAWLWIGSRVYRETGSIAADLGAALLGIIGTGVLASGVLTRIDGAWIRLRRRAGQHQPDGALPQVVAVVGTFGLALFFVWYYLLSNALIIPFMPMH